MARGSLAETEYHLLLAHDLEYISDIEYEKSTDLCQETGYLLHRLINSINRNSK
ncbi:MAG: hypothetical protein DRI56_02065 [Chloroflexota bacterium]|nr:MAG: hypothetical protein DRI56_02065 [Chloroflexota bacterium]